MCTSLQPYVSQVRLPAREVRQQPTRTAGNQPSAGATAAGAAAGAGTAAGTGATAVRVGGGCEARASADGELALLGPSPELSH